MPALYPSMVAPESFQVGDSVRKFITEWNVTPFLGVVTHIIPATCKVWVQWPFGNTPESPERLVKVNPLVSGMPTTVVDRGYSSYEKSLSEKARGSILKRVVPSRDLVRPLVQFKEGVTPPGWEKKVKKMKKDKDVTNPWALAWWMSEREKKGISLKATTATNKMAIRIAHTFATKVIGKLVENIGNCLEEGMSDVQAYNRIFEKYGNLCSDYIIKSSIEKIYSKGDYK